MRVPDPKRRLSFALVAAGLAALMLLLVPSALAGGGPSMAVDPAAFDFGRISEGTGVAQTFTFTTPKGKLKHLTVSLTGSEAFVIAGGSDTCTGARLDAKHSCSIDVVYVPSIDGSTDTATLRVSSQKPKASAAATLTGASLVGTFSETSPTARTFVRHLDWDPGPSHGDVVGAQVRPAGGIVIPPTPLPSSAGGCSPSDFAAGFAGKVALIQRGTCNFGVKVLNAQAAGAVGVIIFNEGNPGREDLFVGDFVDADGNPFVASIPVAFTSFAVGRALFNEYQAGTPPVVNLSVH